MKIIANKIIALIVGLLFTTFTYATPTPPQPIPPVPPELPIGDGTVLLTIMAITLGVYLINKKKASSLT